MATRPWNKQPKETAKSFEAFAGYRDLGPQRSIRKLCELWGRKPSYQNQMSVWSSKYKWVERARLFDAYQDQKLQEVKAAQRLEDYELSMRLARDRMIAVADHLKDFDAKELSARDASTWFDTSFKVLRVIHGDPTEIKKVSGEITSKQADIVTLETLMDFMDDETKRGVMEALEKYEGSQGDS